MSREVQSSRPPAILTALCGAAVLIFGAARTATQSRIIKPQPAANTNSASKRQRVATLRAADSPEGSRVALSSDQSLNDYEAYRRGDRFYVKIPPADVPRAETVRGQAFADVRVQRSADSTLVSFRLQPGATARVEQRGNKLDVVIKMPGASASTSNTNAREVARNDAGPAPPLDSQRKPTDNSSTSANTNPNRPATRRTTTDRAVSAAAKPSPTPKPKPSPTPKTSPTPKSSPIAIASPAVAQQKSSPSATPPVNQPPVQGNTWNNFKERARYWVLLAQLNPVPVAIGAAALLLLFGLLILQRRRTQATRQVRPRKTSTSAATVVGTAKPSDTSPVTKAAVVHATATPSSVAAAAAAKAPAPPPSANERHERAARVSEEVKKIMAGGDYDESVIAANDIHTRQLVGAELLSALVGRNLQRRERARAAFMRHGYFDDATRDLRTAESANERAAAARRLSFVHDREATAHLIGGLDDSSPDVRRAAVEALMDLRDPAAIAPLNSLLQTETDRKVPRPLIKTAIEACATSGDDASSVVTVAPDVITQPAETEREVIEI